MLAEWLMRSALGSRDVDVALIYKRMELTGGGYRRVRVPTGRWVFKGATATATVRFGPFTAPVMFDSLQLLDGEERVEEIAVGLVQLPDGMWETEMVLAGADG